MKNIPIKINLHLPTLLFLLAVTTSCLKPYDPQFPVYYNITNNSNSKIKVIFHGLVNSQTYGNAGNLLAQDSVILFDPGDKKSLFVTLLTAYNKTNPEKGDTLKALYTLRVYRNDTILSNKNFLLTRYWEYSEPNRYKGELDLIVNTNDFN